MLQLANNKHVDIIFPNSMINDFIKNNFYEIRDFIMISNFCVIHCNILQTNHHLILLISGYLRCL